MREKIFLFRELGEDGKYRFHAPYDAIHVNKGGSAHGGFVATMLDMACGFAVASSSGVPGLVPVATVSLTINYMAAANNGPFMAEGQVVGGGRRIVTASATLYGGTCKAVAVAQAVFRREKV